MAQDRKPLDTAAYSWMVLLTALWGFQQVTIKVIADDVSFVAQAAIRSIVATALVLAWARWRGISLFGRDGTLAAGLLAGFLFAVEFVFIYGGLAHTTASRMVVFIYLSPVVTALGLHFVVHSERLSPAQWGGVLLSFAGVALAFADGFFSLERKTLVGDLCGVAAALFWGATTVLIRGTKLAQISAAKTLFYQLAVSAALLPLFSLLLGEPGVTRVTPLAIASLFYQSVIVAFASYLAWFWLLRRYLAARLSVFSFLAPMFGVLFGVVLLGEPLGPRFAAAALLVGLGIVLVNRPR